MADGNFFDRFDGPAGGNFFDQFDENSDAGANMVAGAKALRFEAGRHLSKVNPIAGTMLMTGHADLAAQGATFGFMDDAMGFAANVGTRLGGGSKEEAERLGRGVTRAINSDLQETRDRYPVTGLAAEFGGGVASPAGKVQAVNRFVQGGKSLIGKGARLAGAGGAYGAVAGAGYNNEDRSGGAARGATVGAVLGPAIGLPLNWAATAVSQRLARGSGGLPPILEAVPVSGSRSTQLAAVDRFIGLLRRAGLSDDVIDSGAHLFSNLEKGSPEARGGLAAFYKARYGAEYPKLGQMLDDARFELSERAPAIAENAANLKASQKSHFEGRVKDILGKEDLNVRDARLGTELGKIGDEFETTVARGSVDDQATQELLQILSLPRYRKELPESFIRSVESANLSVDEVIRKNPLRAAHALYSNLRSKARAAKGNADAVTFNQQADVLSGLADDAGSRNGPLFRAGGEDYVSANKLYRSRISAREGLDYANRLVSQAQNDRAVGQLMREYQAADRLTKNSYDRAIRDAILNPLRAAAEGDPARLTRLRSGGVLDAVQRILNTNGSTRGTQIADEIRGLLREAEDLAAYNPASKSDKIARQRRGRQSYSGPLGEGAYGNQIGTLTNVATDIGASTLVGTPVPIRMGEAAVKRGLARAVSPSPSVRSALGELMTNAPHGRQVTPRPTPRRSEGRQSAPAAAPNPPHNPPPSGGGVRALAAPDKHAKTSGGLVAMGPSENLPVATGSAKAPASRTSGGLVLAESPDAQRTARANALIQSAREGRQRARQDRLGLKRQRRAEKRAQKVAEDREFTAARELEKQRAEELRGQLEDPKWRPYWERYAAEDPEGYRQLINQAARSKTELEGLIEAGVWFGGLGAAASGLLVGGEIVMDALGDRRRARNEEIWLDTQRQVPVDVLAERYSLPIDRIELIQTEMAVAQERRERRQRIVAQERLAELGFDPGPADGEIGPQTRRAIIRYERSLGLPATGQITPELVQSLESGEDDE